MIKLIRLVVFFLFLQGCFVFGQLGLGEFPQGECFSGGQKFVLYDCGSTGVRAIAAFVNCRTGTIEIFHEEEDSAGFDLETRYHERIFLLRRISRSLELKYGYMPHIAIGTGGFRRAGDIGRNLTHDIEQMIGIDINIIPQKHEGSLGYLGAKLKNPDIKKGSYVVDVGGSTIQITHEDFNVTGSNPRLVTSTLRVAGAKIASESFYQLVMRDLFNSNDFNCFPYPVDRQDLDAIIAKAKEVLLGVNGFGVETIDELKFGIESGREVYAIGPFFKFLIGHHVRKFVYENSRVVTKDNLESAMNLFLNKTTQEVELLSPNPAKTVYFKVELTGLVLLYALMDLLEMNDFSIVESGNTDGLLAIVKEKCECPFPELLPPSSFHEFSSALMLQMSSNNIGKELDFERFLKFGEFKLDEPNG